MLIIPAIDLKDGKCVRLIQGEMDKATIYNEDPLSQALAWEESGAKLIHIVDLDGAFEGKPKNRQIIETICREVKTPIQLGGGIRNRETVESYINAGVDRIVIGSLFLKDFETAKKIAIAFPNKIVAGIDVKENVVTGDGWVSSSSITGKELANKISSLPLAGIVFTDISKDGMMQGANIEAIADMAKTTRIPLIASGGVSSNKDLDALAKLGGVTGAIIGKAVYTGAIDLKTAIADYQC